VTRLTQRYAGKSLPVSRAFVKETLTNQE
jgi:hypothetical protein